MDTAAQVQEKRSGCRKREECFDVRVDIFPLFVEGEGEEGPIVYVQSGMTRIDIS